MDVNSSTEKSMKLKLVKKYKKNDFSIDKLRDYGLKSVRSARRISLLLHEELQKK